MQDGSATQNDVRVEDYLNDQLQNAADLDGLDALLATVREQQELLKKQLVDAESIHADAADELQQHVSALEQRARGFQRQQRDIDRRLLVVTQSDTSDDAVRQFESSMEKLRKVDVARGYVRLLQDVDEMSAEAASRLEMSAKDALGVYTRMQTLAVTLQPLQSAAEDAAPHLLDHVEKTTQRVRRDIKDVFASDLEKVFEKIHWPRADAAVPEHTQQEWIDAVGRLLDLQRPELENTAERGVVHAATPKAKHLTVLLPLEVMVQPLEMRFRYHFDGNRPTNRLDKPEYFLSHVLDLVNTYNPFVTAYLQPILLDHFRNTNLARVSTFVDATSAFITTLFPMLRSKIFHAVNEISAQPQLLSHMMHELMEFDRTLREDWRYEGGNPEEGWNGLTWEVLVTKNWFARWLQVEKNFALSRYQSIIDAPDSGELDFDSVDPSATKPTKAAMRVNDLLETVTDRYRLLSSFSQKLRFLIDIQISIFDRYHERLHSALEAYLAMTSAIARTVQAVSKEELANLQGLGGLDRLCRVFGSADYVERALRDWSDDVFFLELWEELQHRASSRPGSIVAGHMTFEDIAERTSSAVGSGADGGGLFDETANAYSRLRVRSEGIITDTLSYNVRDVLRPYGRINPWSSLVLESGGTGSASISPELNQVVQQLTTSLSLLSKCLAPPPLRRITRQILLSVQTYLWDHVLVRNSFSSAGVAQLSADLSAIHKVVDAYVGRDYAQHCMQRLTEAIRLLGLPIRGEDGENGQLGLWEVEKCLFADNDSARAVLEELGICSLTESEARHMLERRVELGS